MSDCRASSTQRPPDLLLPGGSPPSAPWVVGRLETPAGPVPQVSTAWTREEGRGALRCRLSNRFRMRYAVAPGLYAAGRAGPGDPVLVTANYKLSFDLLRRELSGRRAWILVLDTGGINVWCAAGKGSFGTAELLRRVERTGLNEVVGHRRLVLPQLAAPGLQAHHVEKACGFKVLFGPVRARDLPEYLDAGCHALPDMRSVSFTLAERLALTPMELVPALKRLPWVLLGVFLLCGLTPRGILFGPALAQGWPLAALGGVALLAGALLTPVLLPVLPFRSFALKGLTAGLAVCAAFVFLVPSPLRDHFYLRVAALLFFPVVSSFLALTFTGSTPITGISGVRRELRYALPLYAAALAAAAAAAVVYKLAEWGVLAGSLGRLA